MDLAGGDSPQGDDDILLGALDSELAGLRMEGEGREESELFLNQLLDSSGEVYTLHSEHLVGHQVHKQYFSCPEQL